MSLKQELIEKQILILKTQSLLNPDTKFEKEEQIKKLREMLIEEVLEKTEPTISLINTTSKNKTVDKLSILKVFKECNIDEEDYFYFKEINVFQILKNENKQYKLSDISPTHTAIKSAFENYQTDKINIIKF